MSALSLMEGRKPGPFDMDELRREALNLLAHEVSLTSSGMRFVELHELAMREKHRQARYAGVGLAALLALQRLIAWRDDMDPDEAGYPAADPGCIVCTQGTVPNRYNTGLCPWHEALRVLEQM